MDYNVQQLESTQMRVSSQTGVKDRPSIPMYYLLNIHSIKSYHIVKLCVDYPF